MKQFTDITVLLDRSGSMSVVKEAMETAFDAFIKEHRSVPTTKLTLVQFDDRNDQDVVYQCVPIRSAERLRLHPRGNTPLLDAMCKVIDRTGERLASMPEAERPDQVLLVIITDGQENASHIYKRKDVFDRVTKQRESYKWEFVYLGANQDTFAETQSFGIPWKNVIKYSHDHNHAVAALDTLRSHTHSYAIRASASVPDFDEEERIKTATKADRDKDSDKK